MSKTKVTVSLADWFTPLVEEVCIALSNRIEAGMTVQTANNLLHSFLLSASREATKAQTNGMAIRVNIPEEVGGCLKFNEVARDRYKTEIVPA